MLGNGADGRSRLSQHQLPPLLRPIPVLGGSDAEAGTAVRPDSGLS